MVHKVETAEEARQGETPGWVRRVLILSVILAVGFMVGSYVFSV